VTGPKKALAEARKHLPNVIEQVHSVRWQLRGIQHSLPESIAEGDVLEDIGSDMDAITQLRTTIACVLEDCLRPLLEDLEDVLASTAKAEEP
jgi:hypothetical protein